MRWLGLIFALLFALNLHAKTFKNSYVSFNVPDDWTCVQEGVAWTCSPKDPIASKEAVIVLAAKVAGPQDNLTAFLNFLKRPKRIKTKVGTPMPSQVVYAEKRSLDGQSWIQAEHLGSEIQDYYTLYLAIVKDHLAILVSFSSEKTKVNTYNQIFDKAIRSLKIVASQQLLFPRSDYSHSGIIGIQVPVKPLATEDMMPPPIKRKPLPLGGILGVAVLLITAGGVGYWFWDQKKRRRKSTGKIRTLKRK